MNKTLPYLNPELFTWSRWRSGSLGDFNIPYKFGIITSSFGKIILRKHAVGYCKADGLLCRPKPNEMAVMFFITDYHFWTHLRNKEFEELFENET